MKNCELLNVGLARDIKKELNRGMPPTYLTLILFFRVLAVSDQKVGIINEIKVILS
ncbi:MAG: hypothetical protein IMF01_00820 [Proteobacteria bacterium]|nr:hypothetical protein [Pseudomonadota bacterium]